MMETPANIHFAVGLGFKLGSAYVGGTSVLGLINRALVNSFLLLAINWHQDGSAQHNRHN